MPHRTLLVVLVVVTAAPAQDIRFELGQRLRRMEQTLAEHHDRAALHRAIVTLEPVTPTFFRGQLTEAARLLDESRFALRAADPPGEAVRWAEALWHRPATRLLDVRAGELKVSTAALYNLKIGRPERVQVRHTLRAGGKTLAQVSADLHPLPAEAVLRFKNGPDGDHVLQSEIIAGANVLATVEQGVSQVIDLSARMRRLQEALPALEKTRTTDRATLARLVGLLTELANRRTLETNYPAARLLREAEALLAAIRADQTYYRRDRPGQFWLALPGEGEGDPYPVRVQVPPAARTAKALPLVVALHGASGSENMFFDGYGDGMIARLCAERGWLLLTTRSPLFAFAGVDVAAVVDALARHYPIDRERVFLVGHSMGAAQAVANAGRQPGRFRAVAALGGGGGFRESESLKAVRFFVGIGERDFALGGARTLHRRLRDAGVSHAVLRSYADVEHITVVQHALPDVFAFFDASLDRGR